MGKWEKGHINRAAILNALNGELTIQEIATTTGIAGQTVARHLRLMRQAKQLYVVKWRRPGRADKQWSPCYAIGKEIDAPHPKGTKSPQAIIRRRIKVMPGNPFASLIVQVTK